MSRSEYRAEEAITIAITPNEWHSQDLHTIKRARGSLEEFQASMSAKSRPSGKVFFKTKLCGKFQAGICNYTNCNFAHGVEELRRPPEEHMIPILASPVTAEDTERLHKGRRCKKFYTGEGCPYGDSCTFIHDELSRDRESVAITVGSGGGTTQKPSNWKTRICNKWEMTRYCPFGSKCHFAHGTSELHKYGGGLVEVEDQQESSKMAFAMAMTPEVKSLAEIPITGSSSTIAEIHLRRKVEKPRGGHRSMDRWRGPKKISKIYGDWIDDNE